MNFFEKAGVLAAYIAVPFTSKFDSVASYAKAEPEIHRAAEQINSLTQGQLKAAMDDSGMTAIGAVLDHAWLKAEIQISGARVMDESKIKAFGQKITDLTGLVYDGHFGDNIQFESAIKIARHFEGGSVSDEMKAYENNKAGLTEFSQIASKVQSNATNILGEINKFREEARAANPYTLTHEESLSLETKLAETKLGVTPKSTQSPGLEA